MLRHIAAIDPGVTGGVRSSSRSLAHPQRTVLPALRAKGRKADDKPASSPENVSGNMNSDKDMSSAVEGGTRQSGSKSETRSSTSGGPGGFNEAFADSGPDDEEETTPPQSGSGDFRGFHIFASGDISE